MPMKEKVVIQSTFDVEYTCVIEHMVHVSDSPQTRMSFFGMDFLAKIGEVSGKPNANINGLPRQVC